MPELYGPAVRGLGSRPRGLRVRLGDRRGEEGRASGSGEGESESWPAVCMTVGKEWALVIGGALSEPELLWERRWEREYGDRFRGCGRYMAERSEDGSVCARGVVGRLDELLSSEELLSWRLRVLCSAMLSTSSRTLSARLPAELAGGARKSDWLACSSITSGVAAGVLVRLWTGVGPAGEGAVVMALRRWMRSSWCGSSFAAGGKDTLGVMAASRVNT
jgi:hypothetical protein